MTKLTWDTESDWHSARDSPGAVADAIGDHPGGGTVQQGYRYGSLTRGLVGYWPLDEGSGSTAGDETELGNDGTVNGAAWVSGYIGSYALDFDGTDDSVDFGTLQEFGNTDWTFSCWAKSSGGGVYFSWGDGDADIWWRYISGNSTNSAGFDDGSTKSNTSISDISDGNWHLVTVVHTEGSGYEIWVDAGTDATSGENGSINDSTNSLYIGYDVAGGQYGSAIFDEVRLYERALSQQEITALYNRTSPSPVTAADTLQ